ncbi:XRE family transcriptional regulator [Azonexus fungiphilus]|uniref:XRE family transcriptional regulator n=1 Tax=Azonexus fungiphilus TaxID=146940 RepID=UPI003CCC6A78
MLEYRYKKWETQAKFWGRFCVSQSAGCRYENGRLMPPVLQLLVVLHMMKRLTDKDLEMARKILMLQSLDC